MNHKVGCTNIWFRAPGCKPEVIEYDVPRREMRQVLNEYILSLRGTGCKVWSGRRIDEP